MSCKHCGGTRLTGDVVEREGIGDPCPHCHGETQGRGEDMTETWEEEVLRLLNTGESAEALKMFRDKHGMVNRFVCAKCGASQDRLGPCAACNAAWFYMAATVTIEPGKRLEKGSETMDTPSAREAKTALEDEIACATRRFEGKTGLRVTGISHERHEQVACGGEIVGFAHAVEVTAEL